jgi:hypothetical protein
MLDSRRNWLGYKGVGDGVKTGYNPLMLLRRPPDICPSEITDERAYHGRREATAPPN